MTDTASSTAKSVSGTDTSESDHEPLVADRWSHNITYRQLVLTSCVGIVQFWWHPYIHDLTKLIPFVFLYNVFSCVVAFPMFYLELAIGMVTRKSVLKCWDLSPAARGIGFSMLLCCAVTAFATSVVCAYCLALFVHSFHSFLPWLHCAAAASPPCSARHRPLNLGSETPAQSFFLNYVLKLKRNGLDGGLGSIIKELAIYFVISWFLIYLIAIKRIYSYSKMVLFKDILAFFVIICCAIGVVRLGGASIMFAKADWSALMDSKAKELSHKGLSSVDIISCFRQKSQSVSQIVGSNFNFNRMMTKPIEIGLILWKDTEKKVILLIHTFASLCTEPLFRVAIEYSLIEMAISQGSLIMLGAYCPKEKQRLTLTAFFAFVVAKGTGLCTTLILGATHGALSHDYNNNTNIIKGSATSMILWSDYVARVPGSQFWSAVVFFTMFVVAITSTALLVQTIMSSFTGKSVRKMGCATLLSICFLLCIIGCLLLCSQGGLYTLDFVMRWVVCRVRVPIAALYGTVITYMYGQSRFCEDVFHTVGEYPPMLVRISWAVVPPILIAMFTFLAAVEGAGEVRGEGALGWSVVALTLAPFALILLFYMAFKCRVRNMVTKMHQLS